MTVTGRDVLRLSMLAGLGALTLEIRWIWRYHRGLS